MKTRFNTFDIICGVAELQKLVGWRVNQIYDVDNKTYLFRMTGTGAVEKVTLLIESGTRFHTTRFEWPKNMAPSGFSMKLRKHLKNKRLEKIQQLGGDRIVDFQFGTGDAAYHVILELYDRGNLILTDYELTTLYILRPHTEGENLRFAMREKYPVERAKQATEELQPEKVAELLENANNGDYLRQVLMPNLDCGPAVIEHVLVSHGLDNRVISKETASETPEGEEKPEKTGKKQKKGRNQPKLDQKPFDMVNDLPTVQQAVKSVQDLIIEAKCGKTKGYIIQVKEEKPTESGNVEYFFRNIEFHPYLFAQFKEFENAQFESFMEAVDEFYSTQESQKIDMKTLHQEREALKKLSNVKNDHAKRLEELTKVQDVDRKKAELITSNQSLVDNAIRAVQSAIASQLSWPDIHELVKEAQANGDAVASSIKQLKLETNHISLMLSDPYENDDDDETPEVTVVDVDLALSAWANARRYYDMKRSAAQKEKKTVDASQKALKSAERKTQQTLKEVRTISNIVKARKVFWFEKFYWFISSENYLVIGGRDAQQNELIVKRYMRPKDIYVHAEIQGASSVIIQNPTGEEIPPKTLLEAGSMAISYSVAWDAKVVTNSYWVTSDQVSKTAPTGEYLATGSFMIRGKKNFLPSCHLTMGLSLLFKLEDSFIERHLGERKVRNLEDDANEQDFKEPEVTHDLLSDEEDSAENPLANVSEPSSNTDTSIFPNTEVKIEHDTGRITVRANSLNGENEENEVKENVIDKLLSKKPADEETTIILAGPSRKKQVSAKKTKEEKARAAKQEAAKQEAAPPADTEAKNPSQVKRGQKGKLKKMKLKYKDQDDEEREIRMMILKSSGKEKPQSSSEKVVEKNVTFKEDSAKPAKNLAPKNPAVELDDADEVPAGGDVDILNSLTGQPHEGDELLFAIPVVAPYQALQNYKFKVKLTPGTGKRGKAAKLALNIFAKEKSCNTREKDLLKSIKEESLARNIPGKVKLSAPQLQKYHK
ncbi:ribosome quality control complex subunit NEMF homolog [Drosophila kikkawai]|uniref:Ribosome quality control complex subunit NEMF homolog n=1 Tax=Drosophila kikkawai TaxID=30033 RepID=A0A6P4HWR5_DROKI|nr:nuclear export mediator factor NEMF homolog [Drosophila kikkawai]